VNGAVCGTAEVQWEQPTGAPVPNDYQVLRGSSDIFSLAQEVGTPAASPFVDTTVFPGTHYYYWVLSRNNCGTGLPNTQPAQWMYEALSIVQQPAGVSVSTGQSADFTVGTSGGGAATYQWRHNGQALVDGGPISGATSEHLTIDPVSTEHAGQYDVLIDDGCDELTSDPAMLTVIAACYADCNADGSLNLSDFGCFQTKFALGDPYADCNGDGVRNLSDFGCFQTKFALGCP
jgi:hypothetical protein